MADSDVQITAGSGTKIDTRTVGAGTDEHRQVMVVGSPSTASDVAAVTAANGLAVDVTRVQGQVTIGDGTNAVSVDNSQNDAESNGQNSLHTSSRTYVFNGTTWDRVRGDIANGMDVDVTRLPELPAGTQLIGRVKISDGTNDLVVDTAHNDNESATENHLDVAARLMGLNDAGTYDRVRATVSVNKNATYTSAQTGTAIWTPAAGKAVVITSVQIQSYGTTAGTATLWFGASADTTFTRGTDAAVFDGEFAPSATNKPGVVMPFPTPVRGTADYVLRVTTTNAQSITVNVWGYEI